VTLPDPPETDSEGNTRTFSIASSPFENQLMFTTRMRDTAFKRSLKKIPLGTEMKVGSAMQVLDLNLPWQSFDIAHELTTKGIQKFVADYQEHTETIGIVVCTPKCSAVWLSVSARRS
jgi:hypothetical protein